MVHFTKKKTILDSNPKPQGNKLAPEPVAPERSQRVERCRRDQAVSILSYW